MVKLSIALPTSDMRNREYFFGRCLDSLWSQSFQDFEIVVTDNCEDSGIENMCKYYGGIRYFKNPRKGMAQNTNEAIKKSSGKLIKILYMDDFMAHDNALREIVHNFEGNWLVTGCTHQEFGESYTHSIHTPSYSKDIHTGNNTIGSPSVLTIKNDNPLLFDEEMTWLLDADYYKRLYEKYGSPTILRDVNVVIGLHKWQATHTMGEARKVQEYEYITKKYG